MAFFYLLNIFESKYLLFTIPNALQIANNKYLFNELCYLCTRHHSSLLWAEIKLNQMVPSAWRKIEQYANKHFTFCLQCKIMGDEDIKILLCDLVRNHYKILVIWTIDAFESVQCSDHAKQKTTTKNLWLIISNVLSFQFPSLEWSQAVSLSNGNI